jgi:hypothetical protein
MGHGQCDPVGWRGSAACICRSSSIPGKRSFSILFWLPGPRWPTGPDHHLFLGEKKAKQESISLFKLTEGGGAYERVVEGIFLRTTDRKKAAAGPDFSS